ncbi:hypothetical protein AGIG_G1530 [Arapaima gigas]
MQDDIKELHPEAPACSCYQGDLAGSSASTHPCDFSWNCEDWTKSKVCVKDGEEQQEYCLLAILSLALGC